MRRVAHIVAPAAILFWASISGGADGDGRSVAIVVEGVDAEAVAAAVSAHVAAPNTTGNTAALKGAIAAHGTKTLAPAVGNRAKNAQLVKATRAALADAHVDLAILVARRKDKRLHVWAIDKDGAKVDKDLAAGESGEAVWGACASLVPAAAKSAPPKAEEPTPTPERAAPPSPEPVADKPGADQAAAEKPAADDAGRARAKALLVVHAALDVSSRHLSYVDRITPTLRPYDLSAAPLASLHVELYPLARTNVPVARGIGITGGFARAVGLGSADESGTKVSTSWQRFDVGARGRFEVGRSVIVGVGAGFGAIDFHFGDLETAVLPSVSYRFLRFGPDARVLFGNASIFLGGAYLPVLSTGAFGDHFPHASKGGIEARAGGAYLITQNVEASLELAYTRFYYTLRPESDPPDPYVAGGALDQMASISLGLAYLF
jgi:hypothetical protein